VHFSQEPLGAFEQYATGGGQLYTACSPDEKFALQLVLEVCDVLGNRGGGVAERVCRSSE
jgi:hypothetical protein